MRGCHSPGSGSVAAKLTAFRGGKIRRLIINVSHYIDFIEVIFHPTRGFARK
jgi:hypothetical protein